MIISTKHEVIYRIDKDLFKRITKLVFKKGVRSLYYSSPLILVELLDITAKNEWGLGVFHEKIKQIFLKQNEYIKVSKW